MLIPRLYHGVAFDFYTGTFQDFTADLFILLVKDQKIKPIECRDIKGHSEIFDKLDDLDVYLQDYKKEHCTQQHGAQEHDRLPTSNQKHLVISILQPDADIPTRLHEISLKLKDLMLTSWFPVTFRRVTLVFYNLKTYHLSCSIWEQIEESLKINDGIQTESII